jgi:hypothetical protein
VAPTVDEEGGGAGDAAQLRAIDVLCDTSGAGVLTQRGREAVEVEAELLGVADEVVEAKSVLMVEQEVVHLPERALVAGRLRALGGELGVRVDVGERQVPPDVHDVAELAEELTDDRLRLAAEGALEIALLDDGDRRVDRSAHVVALRIDLDVQIRDRLICSEQGGDPQPAGEERRRPEQQPSEERGGERRA